MCRRYCRLCARMREVMPRSRIWGGGGLVAEETCPENFSTPNSGTIFSIALNNCGAIFSMLFFFGHQVQNVYPVLNSGDKKG